MTEPAPEPVTETWTYGGIRAGKDAKKWHAWVDPGGEEHWFARTGGRMAVGSHYTAQVTRRDDGGITLHGTPEYAESQAGQETRAALWTEHTLAQTRIEALRAERDGRPPRRPGRGDRPAPGTGRPAAHQRAARRPRRLRHPQAPQHLEHPEAPGRPAIEEGEITCDYAPTWSAASSGSTGPTAATCRKEAQRSDSAGHVEEFWSKAAVITGLWSDIIAEDPETYGTPGGLAGLEAGTIFLPWTGGLPDD